MEAAQKQAVLCATLMTASLNSPRERAGTAAAQGPYATWHLEHEVLVKLSQAAHSTAARHTQLL
jgi:hypothetical protein